jgi:hypothetical protein
MYPDGNNSKVCLQNGKKFTFQMPHEDLIANIFSDRPDDYKDYQIIEINHSHLEPISRPQPASE